MPPFSELGDQETSEAHHPSSTCSLGVVGEGWQAKVVKKEESARQIRCLNRKGVSVAGVCPC